MSNEQAVANGQSPEKMTSGSPSAVSQIAPAPRPSEPKTWLELMKVLIPALAIVLAALVAALAPARAGENKVKEAGLPSVSFVQNWAVGVNSLVGSPNPVGILAAVAPSRPPATVHVDGVATDSTPPQKPARSDAVAPQATSGSSAADSSESQPVPAVSGPLLDNGLFSVTDDHLKRHGNTIFLSFVIKNKTDADILMAVMAWGVIITDEEGVSTTNARVVGLPVVGKGDVRPQVYSTLNPGVATPVSVEFPEGQRVSGSSLTFKVDLLRLADEKTVIQSFGRERVHVPPAK